MTKKVRKMSMALETYLNDVNEEDISTDQDVQRVFCQDKKFVDELVITVLTEDCLRCTPIFHDAIKCGTNGSQYTVHDHPLLAGEWIRDTVVEHDIDKETKAYIARLCESHSGQWVSNKRSKVVLPKPENNEQFLVHLCDYLSSRSNIDMTYSDEVYDALGGIEVAKEDLPDINEYKLTFGKHAGMTLLEIQNVAPGYIRWAKENITREPVRSLLAQM